MKYLLLVLAMFITTGCAAEDSEQLIGQWRIYATDYDCVLLADFDEDTNFQIGEGCFFSNNSAGEQLTKGTYTTDGDILTLYVKQTSCPSSVTEKTINMKFSVNENTLRLEYSNAYLQYERRTEKPSGGGGVQYGCWDTDHSFTPGPIVSL